MEEIEIIKPDDWHVHFRDNEILKAVVPETSRHFGRAIVMPNLSSSNIKRKHAIEYKKRIEKAIPKKIVFFL
jgi:dihydroorotase